MNTIVKRSRFLLVALAVFSAPLFAVEVEAEGTLLNQERALVGDVEVNVETPKVKKSFLNKIGIGGEKEFKEELPEIPLDVAEELGFWKQLKKAFAYKTQPQREDNKRETEVGVLMIEGREHYRSGNYKQALESFKEVMQRDPYNITARRYIRDCQEEMMKITLDDFEIVRKERLHDVEKTWIMQPRQQREIDVVIGKEAETVRPIDRNIEQIIPEVRFTGAKLDVVFEALYQESNPKVSIIPKSSMMAKLAEAKQDTITLQLTETPLIEVIKYICKTKGLVWRVDPNAVVISGKDSVKLNYEVIQLSRPLASIELEEEVRSPSDRVNLLLKKIGVPEVEGATVSYNTRQHRLIVNNTAANLKIIKEFIKKFDQTPYQVQIESRFVTINNDKMSQLVFRHFLTKNYRWNRSDKYGDKYYLEAPNKQRELTPGLRYIRSFMDETSFNPLASAYEIPQLVSTGNDYVDYLRQEDLRPNQPGYLQPDVEDIESLYSAMDQQGATVTRQRQVVQATYKTYQDAVRLYTPAIGAGAPNSSAYQSEINRLYGTYQNSLTNSNNGLLPQMATLDGIRNLVREANSVNTSANDGLGKVFDISGVLGPAEYRSVIYALDNSDGTDTIFAPKVTVLNGQRAEIKDVIRIRYNKTIEEAEDQDIDVGDVFSVVYDYAVTPKDWENREYGTRLIVTPSVQSDERTIELDVQPEVSDLDGFRRFVSSRNNEYRLPQFFVQSVKTVVTVNDGDTLVMGGLIRESVVKTLDKTPILGDLPLIGRYWRGESEVAKKSNLLIFINAKMVDPSGKAHRPRTTASR